MLAHARWCVRRRGKRGHGGLDDNDHADGDDAVNDRRLPNNDDDGGGGDDDNGADDDNAGRDNNDLDADTGDHDRGYKRT